MKKSRIMRIVGLVLLILPIVCYFTFRSLLAMRAPGALLPYLLPESRKT